MNIKNLLFVSSLGLMLSACGGSSSSDPDNIDGTVIIDGLASENETLTATVSDDNGVLAENISYTWSADDVLISDAQSSSFVLDDAQVGSTITVTATYTDEDGFIEVVTSAATDTISAVNDGGTISISGNPVVGEQLTTTVSDDDGVSGAITYQWYADNTEITDATNATFTPTSAQIGSTLTVSAMYSDDQNFSEEIESSATGMVTTTAVNSAGTVTLTGETTVGQTLTASTADTNGTATSTITYTWLANDVVITGATASTYTLTADELGDTITARASYTDDDGFVESPESSATAPIVAAIVNSTGSITITGNTVEAETLSAAVTDTNGISTSMITYTWFANGTVISGADTPTYTLTSAEVGTTITASASYTDDDNFMESVTSAATDTIVAATENIEGSVNISGTAAVGETLTAEMVTDANGITGATFTYQWAADGADIMGATSNTHVLMSAQAGTTVTVTVMYTDDDNFMENVTSAATAIVTSGTSSTGTANITSDGTLLVGDTLTANVTDSNGTTNATFTYQWKADDTDITDATSNTYTLTTAEAGTAITVNVTYTDDDFFAEDITSAAATGEDSTNRVFSAVVSDDTELVAALTTASNGDWIVLDGGSTDYVDIGEVDVNTAVTLTKTATATPEISGSMCLVLSSDDGITMDGLTFSDINWISGGTCDSNENASIYLSGDGITLSNNTFASESATINSDNTTNNWVVLKGKNSLVTRNTFIGKDANRKGGFISLASSSSGGDKTGHIVEYNLFKDMIASDSTPDSSAYAIQVGTSTGTDSNNPSNFIVRYNRFENNLGGRRLMRVQTSNATIEGNTVIDSFGAIALEDGMMNTVQDNIIIRTTIPDGTNGTDDEAAGILAHRFGHTISNNYIAGMHTNDKGLGGIVFSVNEIGEYNAGLEALSADTTTDFTMTIERNTVLNSEQPIVFSESWPDDITGEDCDDITETATVAKTKNTFIINFDNNLIINGLNTDTTTQGAYLDADVSTSDHTIEYDCDLLDYTAPGVSMFANNHSFTDSRVSGTASAEWTQVSGSNGNEFGGSDRGQDQMPTGDDIAEYEVSNDGLIEGIGGEANLGADTTSLNLIEANEVGAGSTWTFDSQLLINSQ